MSQQQHEVCVAVRLRDDPQGRQAVLLRVSLQRAARPAGASLGLVRGAPAPPGPQPPLGDVVRAPPPTPQPSLSSHLGPASPPLGILGGRKRRPLALDPATSPVPGRAPSLTHPGAQPGSPWGRATPALSGRPGALCRVGGARQGRGWPSPSSGSDRLCGLGASTPAIWATSVGGHLSHRPRQRGAVGPQPSPPRDNKVIAWLCPLLLLLCFQPPHPDCTLRPAPADRCGCAGQGWRGGQNCQLQPTELGTGPALSK